MITDRPRLPLGRLLLMGFWPSFVKCWLYRWLGHRIGRGVRFAPGSLVMAGHADIGDFTQIGLFTILRCHRLKIGRHVSIGAACFFDTPYVELGDDTKISEQVFVGGLQTSESRLVVGRNCQIMQMTFINPAVSVTIGDDSGIGGSSLVFGHYSWLNRFDGYPVDFRPIEIGRSVAIAWRVFIGAGAKIGDGAVVGANSFVNHTIPPRSLATGTPARVVARPPHFPSSLDAAAKLKIFLEILSEFRAFLQGYGAVVDESGPCWTVRWRRENGWLRQRNQAATMLIVSEPWSDNLALVGATQVVSVVVSLREIAEPARKSLDARGILWLDLHSKQRADVTNHLGEEVVQYLRRHGLRFLREPSNG